MQEENRIVHGVWIGSQLTLLECLTIKLFQNAGHEFHLWSYGPLKNLPQGTVVRNAAEILPEESIFGFDGIPLDSIPSGGIGSLSHWSDQFQCKLLHQEGGIYSQMDVAVLAPMDFDTPYILAPHKDRSLAPVIMKAPKRSEFTKACYEHLSSKINAGSMNGMHWDYSMQLIMSVAKDFSLVHDDFVLSWDEYWDLGARHDGPFYDAEEPGPEVRIIHWSNATNRTFKDRPIRNSFYAQLLERMGLIEPDDPILQAPGLRRKARNSILSLKKMLVPR
ncbi:hypothetical protein MK489_19170 [Myxococcota bacterium]|nr:hypothetical protein [Myxococcota bacterium]